MQRLGHQEHGYIVCGSDQETELLKAGWKIVTNEQWKAIIAAKRGKPVETAPEPATIAAPEPVRRGRPRKSDFI